ncbi:MAG: hypothetical protein ACMUIS_01790 [bacterium]
MHLLLAILIPALAAFWVFIDARDKGRSEGQALLWAFGTFMAMIIFLPLWLFIRWQTSQQKNVHTCQACRRSFREIPGARYCPYCGHPLFSSQSVQTINVPCQEREEEGASPDEESQTHSGFDQPH